MKTENAVLSKSMDFAVRVIRLCRYLRETKSEYVLAKQLLKAGTSIGANLRERLAVSRATILPPDCISHSKKIYETSYWLEPLYRTEYLSQAEFDNIAADCGESTGIVVRILKPTKQGAS